jgi:hypothetical protein
MCKIRSANVTRYKRDMARPTGDFLKMSYKVKCEFSRLGNFHTCFPTTAYLSRRFGRSSKQIQRYLRYLKTSGQIEVNTSRPKRDEKSGAWYKKRAIRVIQPGEKKKISWMRPVVPQPVVKIPDVPLPVAVIKTSEVQQKTESLSAEKKLPELTQKKPTVTPEPERVRSWEGHMVFLQERFLPPRQTKLDYGLTVDIQLIDV